MKKRTLVIGGIAAATLLIGGWAFAQSGGHSPGSFGPGFMHSHGFGGMGPRGMRPGNMGPRAMGPGNMGPGGMMGMRGQMGGGMMAVGGPGMMAMMGGNATMAERSDIYGLLFESWQHYTQRDESPGRHSHGHGIGRPPGRGNDQEARRRYGQAGR